MRIAILLHLWLLLCASVWAMELKVVQQKPAAEELRTSPLLFILNDGNETFTYWHDNANMWRLGDNFLPPVQRGHLFAYAGGCNLIVFDGSKRAIVARFILPENISRIAWRDEQNLEVEVMVTWASNWGKDQRGSQASYTVTLGQPNTHLPGCGGLLAYRCDESDVSRQIEKFGLKLEFSKKEEGSKISDGIPARLAELAKLDPANPWVDFFAALYAYRNGSQQEAIQLWQNLCGAGKAKWYHLLRMGIALHYLEQTTLARGFHEAGMRQYFSQGFQPYMNTTLNELMTHKGGLGDKIAQLREEKKWQEASALLEEYYEFAPRCEAFCGAMLYFSDELEQAGLAALAQTWRGRAEVARYFQSVSSSMGNLEVWFHIIMTVFLASMFAVALFIAFMMTKSPVIGVLIRARRAKRSCRYRLLTRAALLSILLTMLLSALFASVIITGMTSMSRMFRFPLGAMSKMNHPRGNDWLGKLPESQSHHFYNGLTWQVQGEYAKARAEYTRATAFAQTYHNLGMLDKAEGKDPNQNFMQALALNAKLPETIWVTRHEATSPWLKVYEKYCGDGNLLAMPSGEIYAQLVCPTMFDLRNLSAIRELDTFFNSDLIIIAAVLALGMLLLLFVSLARAYPAAEECKLPFSWWLSLLLPGTSKYWSFTGCLVATLWLSCGWVVWMNYQYAMPFPTFSMLEAMATPSVGKAFGVPETILNLPLRTLLMNVANVLLYALPLLNLLLLIVEYKADVRTMPAKPAESKPAESK
jgi:tetratricopeptide (TPR) repeat protein